LIEQRLNAAQVKLQRLEAVLDSQKDAESVNFSSVNDWRMRSAMRFLFLGLIGEKMSLRF